LFHKGATQDFYEGLQRVNLYDARESSVGLALLAELSAEQLQHTFTNELSQELIDTIEQTRKQGFSAIP
jgi:DNA-binding IclR family transcriptional regulator